MEAFVAETAYLGIFVFMVLTGAGLPIPEEVAILAAAVLSEAGELHTPLALAALVLGGLVGDGVVYAIGSKLGDRLVQASDAPRRFWQPRVNPQRYAQVQQILSKHGLKVLFVARFLVGVRIVVYLAVGAAKMPFARFMLLDSICALTVIGAFFALGFFFSRSYGDAVYAWLRTGQFAATAMVVVLLLVALWWRHRSRRTV
jgi:membrane protein DedA with SNARE-associated domain